MAEVARLHRINPDRSPGAVGSISSHYQQGQGAILGLSRRETLWRAADLIVDALVKEQVRLIFGVPGGTIAPLNDALIDTPEIRTVTHRHEAGAVFAAAGYARASQEVGVVMVTSGPGVLNTFTGLASAYCDGIPVLVLAGEVPRHLHGKGAMQEGSANALNVVGMARNITKMAVEVTDANAAPAAVAKALATARSGRRGPVLLSIPMDVASAQITRPGLAAGVTVSWSWNRALIDRIAHTLANAKRPLLFVGSGARWDGAPERLRTLAERLGAPVATTPKGKGIFPESHRLALGVFGHGGHISARRYLEEGVDVLLAVGTGFSDPATDGWSPLLHATEHLIQIDADAAQIGRNYPVSVGLVGPAATLAEEITDAITVAPSAEKSFGVQRFSDANNATEGVNGMVTPGRALRELQAAMPSNAVYTCDIGQHLLFSTHFLQIDDPLGFVIMTGLASMGSSIGAAIGTKLALKERPVVAICGDGCFAMQLGDVATAVREKVSVLVAVLNDRRYGMVEIGDQTLYGRTPGYSCAELDIAAMAKSVGARSFVIEANDQLWQLGAKLYQADGPTVLDIRVDPSVTMPRIGRFSDLAEAADPSGSEARHQNSQS